MPKTLRPAVIRLAHSNESIRPHLLPLLKQAMEFDTPEAMQAYLKEHPGADKSNHHVKKKEEESKKDDGGGAKKDERHYDEVNNVHLEGISKEEWTRWLEHPEGKELREKYKMSLIAGHDGVVSKEDLERAISVRRKLKAINDAEEAYEKAEKDAEAKGEKKPEKLVDDVCTTTPAVCAKNLGIERSSMPQFSPPGKNVKEMLAALTDKRHKEIKDDIAKIGERAAKDKLSEEELDNFHTRENAESAVASGADPNSEKGTFDTFLDRLRKKGVDIEDLTKEGMPVKALHATQAEIRASKAYSNANKYLAGKNTDADGNLISDPKDVIYVSSDNHILDGHHRWSGFLLANPDAKIPVVKIGMPMKELLEESFQSPGVFRQDLNFKVVPEDNPIDLAREKGSTWKQRNGKWYGKNSEGKNGKAGGPFESQEAAKDYASGKKAASLRSVVIRLAAQQPDLRGLLLPLLA